MKRTAATERDLLAQVPVAQVARRRRSAGLALDEERSPRALGAREGGRRASRLGNQKRLQYVLLM